MTVRTGREFLSIPGPTNIPDEVLNAMHQPAIEIYSGRLQDITQSSLQDLRKIFCTEGRLYIYIANGHGAWEAALTNTLSRGDKILILESGRFATAWGDMGVPLGLEPEVLTGNQRGAVDLKALEERLRSDATGDIKAVLVVQIDTASGVVNDIAGVRRALDSAGHPALLMVDTIASLATMPFEMDQWGVDVAVSGSQKGLMMPPGLSFVATSSKARAAHQKADLRTRYWDWTAREGGEHYLKYCGTPPVHMLFALRKALDMLLDEGLENVFKRHTILARAVHRAVEAWAEQQVLEFNIQKPSERSAAVTTVLLKEPYDPAALLTFCEQKCGVVLGIGIGGLGNRAFRIAHMGYVNAPMILGTLGVVETGLRALNIPHGRGGIQAAVESLADSLAD